MFAAVIDGKNRNSNPLFTVYSAINSLAYARLGVTVSRKVSLKAVVRNRIKRVIRESFRQQQTRFKGQDIVVIAAPRANRATAKEVARSLQQHWDTLAT